MAIITIALVSSGVKYLFPLILVNPRASSLHDTSAKSELLFSVIDTLAGNSADACRAVVVHEAAIILNESVYVLPRGHAVIIARELVNAQLAIHSDAARIAVKNKRVFKFQNLAACKLNNDVLFLGDVCSCCGVSLFALSLWSVLAPFLWRNYNIRHRVPTCKGLFCTSQFVHIWIYRKYYIPLAHGKRMRYTICVERSNHVQPYYRRTSRPRL